MSLVNMFSFTLCTMYNFLLDVYYVYLYVHYVLIEYFRDICSHTRLEIYVVRVVQYMSTSIGYSKELGQLIP